MILCFDIGGSAIKAALAHEPSELETLGRVPTPLADFDGFVAALAAFTAEHPGAGVAISITGVVDPASGRIKCANIPAIDGRALASELSTRLDRQVFVGNDADLFALAEAGAGAGRGHRIVFGAIFGTGVGGGLVIDGQMITGAGGFAGEWGHGPVAATIAGDPPVAIPRFACGCGQAGCVDTIGGARGLERLHAHLTGQSLSSVEIVTAWRAGDAASSRTIECYVDLVASPLALVVNIVGADIVPTGGGLGALPDLMARVDIAVRGRILRQTATPIVVPGSLETEPGLVGAALMGFAGRSQ